MNKIILLLNIVVLFVPAASSSLVEFDYPSFIEGDGTLKGLEWILLLNPHGEQWQISINGSSTAEYNYYQHISVKEPFYNSSTANGWHHFPVSEYNNLPMNANSFEEWSSIFVGADSLNLLNGGIDYQINAGQPSIGPNSIYFSTYVPDYSFRPQEIYSVGTIAHSGTLTTGSITINAQYTNYLESQGVSWKCQDRDCHNSTNNKNQILSGHQSIGWKLKESDLYIRAHSAIIITGGRSLDITANGSIRLPNLKTEQNLDQFGISVDGETLRGVGNITLSNLRTGPGNRGTADLSTDLQAASLDGVPIPISTTATASVASLAIIAVLAWKGKAVASYLLGLFTRLDMDAALEHPNRRAIYEYVDANPGPTFRELIRETNMAAGTARHHIAVLGRCDVLIERQYGQTMRYFHRDQGHLGDWDAVVVLRDPEVDRLYRWLESHPNVIQKEILDQAEVWGWSRSTAQHRLKRLVDNGLAAVRDLGRVKHYQALDRNVPRHT